MPRDRTGSPKVREKIEKRNKPTSDLDIQDFKYSMINMFKKPEEKMKNI